MLVTANNLSDLFTGFKTSFNKGFQGANSTYKTIAMEVPSGSREEKYAWLGQLPALREWIGPRIVHGLEVHGYTITNRPFEMTIGVKRDDIEDDNVGVFAPLFENMGYEAARHPDALVYELLNQGFVVPCYDGKPFFAVDHPINLSETEAVPHSNMQAGDGPAWFLIDGSRPIKPLVFQKRRDYTFDRMDAPTDEKVFNEGTFVYGVWARANAGFGLWQLAYGSKAPLTPENYEAARAAMKSVRGDNGRKLGVSPTLLVVPDELEGPALRILKNDTRVITVGEPPDDLSMSVANEWAGSAELVVSSYL
ncbi:Mu-like prophage major head subunit gpT family protein [Roseomonas genomospecies 6]|uniref:Bacteriophage Mu GpT domain-containing protein n=1 Tax=Roseomonas genomospecies 6 TaxID=214106 RepID=A0A9W7U0H8_9PROT|nr:Mu-like prophage major head subunit gpT family protein [Roseomonas genomospecies 6]KAA0683349.1 hypothetical protein DS843_02845 [Roseomonas genomospecies 6]